MKRILLSICCAMSLMAVHAQAVQTIQTMYSEPFEEPEALDSKIVQANNGNTFLFNFTKRDGIQLVVFDKNRKPVATQELKGGEASWDPRDMVGSMMSGVSRGSKVCAIYPTGKDMVLFLEQVSDREPSLYRLVLDGATGKLLREERIHRLPAYEKGASYAMAFGGVRPKGYYVERDPLTDAYAVMAFDGFAEETDKRLELIHYDANNQEIGRSNFEAPERQFKYINYLGMVVDGTKGVHLANYCFNGGGGGASKVFISRLEGDRFEHHPLTYTANLKDTRGTLIVNPVTKNLELVTLSEGLMKPDHGPSKHVVRPMFVVIDPKDYTVLSNRAPMSQLASRYRKTTYDKSESRYQGIPMNITVNADGTTTIVCEDQIPVVRKTTDIGKNIMNSAMAKHTNFFIWGGRFGSISSNMMLDIGVTDYDENSNEKYGYVVRKKQRCASISPALAQADIRNNRVVFDTEVPLSNADANSGFYSFDYISTPSGRYTIFNDHPKNFERDAEKRPRQLAGVSESNTICYRLNNGEMTKSYFFGAPDDSFDNRFALITSGNYSEKTGDYAVLLIERNGRHKQARVAWAKL